MEGISDNNVMVFAPKIVENYRKLDKIIFR